MRCSEDMNPWVPRFAILLLLLPACARYLSDSHSATDIGPGDDGGALDVAQDLTHTDGPRAEMGAGDTSADAGPFVSCGAEVALPTIGTSIHFSPAMRPGGLRLLVQSCAASSCPYYEATRPSATDTFGPWVELAINTNQTDATVFDFQGGERMITTQGPTGARHLFYCDGLMAWPCTQLTFAAGSPNNLDGASVAFKDNTLLLAFNEGDINNDGVALHLATPVSPNEALQWTHRPAAAINALGGAPGDPGLSEDGQVIVFEWAPQVGISSDIYVAFWDAAANDFVDPRPIPGLDTAGWEQEPELFTIDASKGDYEIYYRSNAGGEDSIRYRTCSIRR